MVSEPSWWVEGAEIVIAKAMKIVKTEQTIGADRNGLTTLRALLAATPKNRKRAWFLEEECRKLLEWKQ